MERWENSIITILQGLQGIEETFRVKNLFIIFIRVMISLVCAYVSTYQIAHLKDVQIFACQLYLDKAIFNSGCVSYLLPK